MINPHALAMNLLVGSDVAGQEASDVADGAVALAVHRRVGRGERHQRLPALRHQTGTEEAAVGVVLA